MEGIKHGKFKEYYYKGKIKFVGEYLNGKAKEYENFGKLIFQKEYLDWK